MQRTWLLLVAIALSTAGCILGDVPLVGKSCPCAHPYVCDEARNVCVREGQVSDGGAGDATPVDTGLADGAADAGDATELDAEAADAADAQPDAAPADATGLDASPADATSPDALPADAAPLDAAAADATAPADATALDAAPADATALDAAPADAALPDATPRDAAAADALPRDSGQADAAAPDATIPDSGARDASAPDATPVDAGPLALGADCASDSACASRECLCVTTGTTTYHVCTTGCSSTSDCPVHTSCRTVVWATFCLPERVFTPHETFVTPSGGVCTAASEACQSGDCDTTGLVCRERCMRESDCGSFGGVCATLAGSDHRNVCDARGSAAIGATCATDDDCANGICNRDTDTCARHCCTRGECAANETCANYNVGGSAATRICMPKSAPIGALGLGAQCTFHHACESQTCAPTTTDGSGVMQCTTPCCEDSDCAAMPGGAGRCWPFVSPIVNAWIGYCIPR